MIVFIDESGDPGFKITKGSSSVFVIALIIFDDELDAEETALKIKRLHQSLHKSDNFEFKFNKSDKKLRSLFLNEIKKCRFRVRAIVFEKEKIYSLNLRSSKDKFYNYAVKLVLDHNNDTIQSAKVRIDGLGEKEFRRSLSVYLRHNLNKPDKSIVFDLKFRKSNKDVLIQLADMVVGSIKRSYTIGKTDSSIYKDIIKKRIEDEWIFE